MIMFNPSPVAVLKISLGNTYFYRRFKSLSASLFGTPRIKPALPYSEGRLPLVSSLAGLHDPVKAREFIDTIQFNVFSGLAKGVRTCG